MKFVFCLLFLILCPTHILAAATYSLEVGPSYQSLNDQRIPGKGGTKISLTEFEKGPFPSYRIYLGYGWDRHQIRALYAPFALDLNGELKTLTIFRNQVFQPGIATDFFYKFNSYRLTYSYALEKKSEWDLRLGFTGKIRDAEVKLTQGNISASKKNVGFVPLLHFQGERKISENYDFRFDVDGLYAPQGRAFDVGLFIEHKLAALDATIFGGYRTLEGGADNDKVYNFAWIHTLTIGLRGAF